MYKCPTCQSPITDEEIEKFQERFDQLGYLCISNELKCCNEHCTVKDEKYYICKCAICVQEQIKVPKKWSKRYEHLLPIVNNGNKNRGQLLENVLENIRSSYAKEISRHAGDINERVATIRIHCAGLRKFLEKMTEIKNSRIEMNMKAICEKLQDDLSGYQYQKTKGRKSITTEMLEVIGKINVFLQVLYFITAVLLLDRFLSQNYVLACFFFL